MTRKVKITAGEVAVTATLNDSPTADQVWKALPMRGRASTWGDEVYFGTPVSIQEASDATDVFEKGAVAYWPPGKALCLFFGRTPASTSDKPRMASPGNLVGMIDGDSTVLKRVSSGAAISFEKL